MRFLQAIVMGAALLCASSAAAKTIVLDVSGVLAPNDILHASFTPEQNRLYEIKAVFSQQPTDLVAYTDMEWSRYNYLYVGHTFLWGNNYDDYQNIEFIDGRFVAVRLPTRRTTATGFSANTCLPALIIFSLIS